jgi:hypothetical protein
VLRTRCYIRLLLLLLEKHVLPSSIRLEAPRCGQ